MKIYTRTGDRGSTSLVGGTRVSKTCVRLEAYGTIDELNAHLGMLATLLTSDHDRHFILRLQGQLFVVGAALATAPATDSATATGSATASATSVRTALSLTPESVAQLEAEIDRIDALLPPLRAFVLPGGSPAAAQSHICRTVCRRAERRILSLAQESPVDDEIVRFVNRLSDYLFILARKANKDAANKEIFWENTCK